MLFTNKILIFYLADTHATSVSDERLSETNGTHMNKLTLGPQTNNNK